ncbi:hypothetical protein ONZ51_g394 [Trametes cubensis]|uniref:Uncharacterized protein n=1 Tax=Trametes cubensis TaxID=1111947 RepID=A0AAD7U4V5_9APHY|nr:hypothetical protein ONZ51_g394 [Trametes cubensis]
MRGPSHRCIPTTANAQLASIIPLAATYSHSYRFAHTLRLPLGIITYPLSQSLPRFPPNQPFSDAQRGNFEDPVWVQRFNVARALYRPLAAWSVRICLVACLRLKAGFCSGSLWFVGSWSTALTSYPDVLDIVVFVLVRADVDIIRWRPEWGSMAGWHRANRIRRDVICVAVSDISNLAKIILIVATLVLLLIVSATIIARSYVLRRRQRAIIAEAIRNGTYVFPVRPRLARRPKMFQVAITKELEEDVTFRGEKGSRRTSMEKEKRRMSRYDGLAVKWHKMMPVSCRLLKPPQPLSKELPPSPCASPSPHAYVPRLSSFLAITMELARTTSPVPPEPESSRPESTTPTVTESQRPSRPVSMTPSITEVLRPSRPVSMTPTLAESVTRPSRPVSMTPTLSEPRPSFSTTRALSPVPSEKYFVPSGTPTAYAPTPMPEEERVRVAVLIAMPFALAMAEKKASEYGNGTPPALPCMEFGVCEVLLEDALDAEPLLPPPMALKPLLEEAPSAISIPGVVASPAQVGSDSVTSDSAEVPSQEAVEGAQESESPGAMDITEVPIGTHDANRLSGVNGGGGWERAPAFEFMSGRPD